MSKITDEYELAKALEKIKGVSEVKPYGLINNWGCYFKKGEKNYDLRRWANCYGVDCGFSLTGHGYANTAEELIEAIANEVDSDYYGTYRVGDALIAGHLADWARANKKHLSKNDLLHLVQVLEDRSLDGVGFGDTDKTARHLNLVLGSVNEKIRQEEQGA